MCGGDNVVTVPSHVVVHVYFFFFWRHVQCGYSTVCTQAWVNRSLLGEWGYSCVPFVRVSMLLVVVGHPTPLHQSILAARGEMVRRG